MSVEPKLTYFCIFDDNNLEIETEFIETSSGERFQTFTTSVELTQHLKQNHFQESSQSRVESVDRFLVDHISTQEYNYFSLFPDPSDHFNSEPKEFKLYSNCVFCRRLYHTYKDWIYTPSFIIQSFSFLTEYTIFKHMCNHINYRPLQCALCKSERKTFLSTSRERLYTHVWKAHRVRIYDYRAEKPEQYYQIVREYMLPEIEG